MAKNWAQQPTEINISKQEARRLLLSHHYLWPPRRLKGGAGVLEYLQRVGCIQFDPINVVGRNPDLVLQSRILNYKPQLLEDMLYKERSLLDGWDKLASVHQAKDWPHFKRFRQGLRQRFENNSQAAPVHKAVELVKDAITQRGPLSSIEIEHDERLQSDWGFQIRAVRAAMDMLYNIGELGIHHRVNTRRVFDLTEKLIPKKLRRAPDPHANTADYEEWHVLRRIGGLGLAHAGSGERWLGIADVKSPQRSAALERLLQKQKIVRVRIEDLAKGPFYIRAEDLDTLEKVSKGRQPQAGAAFLGALDNAMWDRNVLRRVFDFDYTWEVYVPAQLRKYGYYVLPVVYGDRFVARFDPAFNKTSRSFTIQNWWWEKGVNKKDKAMLAALQNCLIAFSKYLGASEILLGENITKDRVLKQVVRVL